jgi:hypothetical protein
MAPVPEIPYLNRSLTIDDRKNLNETSGQTAAWDWYNDFILFWMSGRIL